MGELNPITNPLVVREVRSRMRGPRFFLLIFGFQICLLIALAIAWEAFSIGSGPHPGQAYGHQVFTAIVISQAALICILVPALSAGAFTLEREKQTLDMLVMTRLTGLEAAYGKAMGPIMVTGLLLATSAPSLLTCLLMGGVSPSEIAICLLGLALFSVAYSVLATAISAGSRSTAAAVITAEGLAFMFLMLGGIEAALPTPLLVSGLTPISWVSRTCRVEGLSAPILDTTIPFVIPAALLFLFFCVFLLIQAPARLIAPTARHVAIRRVTGLLAYLGVLIIAVWGFMKDMLASGIGASFVPLGHSSGNDLRGVLVLVSVCTTMCAALYANIGAIADLSSFRSGLLRALVGAFRPSSIRSNASEAALPYAIVGWLLGPAVVLVGGAICGESVSDVGVGFMLGLFALEFGVVLLGYFLGLIAALRTPADQVRQRNVAAAWFVPLLTYPCLVFLVWAFARIGTRSLSLSVPAWLSAPSPAGALILFSCAGNGDLGDMTANVAGLSLSPWIVGVAVLAVVLCLAGVAAHRLAARYAAESLAEQ